MRESHLKLRKRRFLQLFKSPAKLIRTRGALCATTYTVELLDDIVNALSAHKLTDSLQVTVTTSQEKHLLDHIVLIGCHIDQLRTCAFRFILDMFRLHIFYPFAVAKIQKN